MRHIATSVVVFPDPGPESEEMARRSLTLAHAAAPEDLGGPGNCHAMTVHAWCFDMLLQWIQSGKEIEACIELLSVMPGGWRWLVQMDEEWLVRWSIRTDDDWGPVMVLQVVAPGPVPHLVN